MKQQYGGPFDFISDHPVLTIIILLILTGWFRNC